MTADDRASVLVSQVGIGNWTPNEWAGFDYHTTNPNLAPVALRVYIENLEFVLVRYSEWIKQDTLWEARFAPGTPLIVVAAAMTAALAEGARHGS